MNQDTEWHSSSEPIRWEVWLWRFTDADSFERDYRFAGVVRKVRQPSGTGYAAHDEHLALLNVYETRDGARAAVKKHALKVLKEEA